MRVTKILNAIGACLTGAALIMSFTAQAGVLSVNFRQLSVNGSVPNGYGVEPADNWTDWTFGVGGDGNMGSPATVANLIDSDGNVSSVNVTFKGNQVRAFNALLAGTPMYSALISYAGSNPTNETFIDLSGLNATFVGPYDVIVYVSGFNANAFGNIGEITDGTETFYFQVPNPFTTNLIQSTDTTYTGSGTADSATYVRFDGRTNDSLYISVDVPAGAGAAGIGGFQIVGTTGADLANRLWVGAANSDWDTLSANWTNVFYGTTNYADGAFVIFDDRAVAASPTVNLTAAHSPGNVTVNSTKNYTFTGSGIAGATGLAKRGTGSLTLANANTYTGNTTISGGTLRIGAAGAIPAGAGRGDVSVATGTTLDLNGVSAGINGLNGAGTVDNTGGAATLTVGLDDDTITFGGTIQGAVSLAKRGTNTMTLNGFNSHSGATLVQEGTLNLSPASSFSYGSALAVSNGATLAVSITNGSGGVYPPSVSLNGGTVLLEYGDASVTGFTTPISVSGSLNLNGVSQIAISGGNFNIGTYTLISYSSKTGAGSISSLPASLPTGMVATISDTGSAIVLNVTFPSIQSLSWTAGDGSWTTNAGFFNWNLGAAEYKEYSSTLGDAVAFSTTYNTFPLSPGTVTLLHDVHPYSVTVAGNYVLAGPGHITGATGIERVGDTGTTFILDNTNTYTGVTTVSGGTLQVNNTSALGSTAAGTVVTSGGSLALSNGITLSGEPLTLNGNGVSGNNGALRTVDTNSTITLASPITLAGTARIRAADGGELIITSPITDNGSNYTCFLHAGATNTIVRINSPSNVAGNLTVFGGNPSLGLISFGVNNVFPGSSLTVGGGLFDLNGKDQTFAGLGNGFNPQLGVLTNSSATLSTLTVNYSGTNSAQLLSAISGNVSFVKEGTGTQSFGGGSGIAHSYRGTTMINGGILGLASDLSQVTNSVTVNAGGTLRGIAKIGGPVTVNLGGTIYAGYASNAIGDLTISNRLSLGGNTIVAVNKDLSPSNDVINVTGSLTYGGTLTVHNIGTNALMVGDTFTVFPPGGTGSFSSIVSDPGATFGFTDGVLTVTSVSAGTPPTLGYTPLGGGVIQFNWTGAYKLQWQTNSLAVGLAASWSDYPDNNNPVNVTNNPAIPATFFRLSSQ